MKLSYKDAERFWAKVDKQGPDDCWPWTASLFDDGYGQFSIKGRPVGAHVVACLLAHGETGSAVMHSCDTRGCCNPGHLIPGTDSANMVDMVLKGRSKSAKLTPKLVVEIRVACGMGETYRAVAARYGVAASVVSQIFNGQIWGFV